MKERPVRNRIKGLISGEIKPAEQWEKEWDEVYIKHFGEANAVMLTTSPLEKVLAFLDDEFWQDYPLMNGMGFGCFGAPVKWMDYLRCGNLEVSYEGFID
ncbi:MAG: hypothetical protein K9N35_05645 [Candidatus Marinimicrobia bacterium]|nr:hypothetical protein [Candidatus Neomarinimicrobiota bacterium]